MGIFIKNKLFLIASLISLYLIAACRSIPDPPRWVLNINEIYPVSEYITGRGEGTTRRDAENRATTVVSQFFLTQVNAVQSSRSVFNTGTDGVTGVERQTIDSTVIETQVQLITTRYAPDPWYDPKTKIWETVAYIKRDEGWEVYEPSAKRQSDALLTIIKAADTETEPFNAFLRYGNAFAYENSAEYSGTRIFAQILYPVKAAVSFAEADTELAALPQKQLTARERSRMFVSCPVDYNGMIFQATVRAIGACGFAVEQNRNLANTQCLIQVEEGVQKREAGIFYYPALTGTISGRNGALFSFKIQADQAGAINPDIAKRRAYDTLVRALEDSFAAELKKYQDALVKN